MTTKHYCDLCGEEMTDGYTVQWRNDIDRSRNSAGLFHTTKKIDNGEKEVCEDCWPGEKDWGGLLGRLVQ